MNPISKTKFMETTLFQPQTAGNYTIHYTNAEEKIQEKKGTKKFSRRNSRRNLLLLLIAYFSLIAYFLL
jgi:hypothetical protein